MNAPKRALLYPLVFIVLASIPAVGVLLTHSHGSSLSCGQVWGTWAGTQMDAGRRLVADQVASDGEMTTYLEAPTTPGTQITHSIALITDPTSVPSAHAAGFHDQGTCEAPDGSTVIVETITQTSPARGT